MARRSDLPPIEIDLSPAAAPATPRPDRVSRRRPRWWWLAPVLAVVVVSAVLVRPHPEPRLPVLKSGLYLWTYDSDGKLHRLDLDTAQHRAFAVAPVVTIQGMGSRVVAFRGDRGSDVIDNNGTTLASGLAPAALAVVGADLESLYYTDRENRWVRTRFDGTEPWRTALVDRSAVGFPTAAVAVVNDSGAAKLVDIRTGQEALFALHSVIALAGRNAIGWRCVIQCELVAIDLVNRAERVLARSWDPLREAVALSPDGARLAIVIRAGTQLFPRVIDVASGDVLWRSEEPIGFVPVASPFAWSPDSRTLFVAMTTNRVIAVIGSAVTEIATTLLPAPGLAVTAKHAVAAAPAPALTIPTTTSPPAVSVGAPLRTTKQQLWAFDQEGRLFRLAFDTAEMRSFAAVPATAIWPFGNEVAVLREPSSLMLIDGTGRVSTIRSGRGAPVIDDAGERIWVLMEGGDQPGHWEARDPTGLVLQRVPHGHEVVVVPIGGDARRVLLRSQTTGATDIFDLATNQRSPLSRFEISSAAHRTGVATVCEPSTRCEILSIDLANGQTRALTTVTDTYGVLLSPDATLLAITRPSVGSGRYVELIDVASGQVKWRSPDGVSFTMAGFGSGGGPAWAWAHDSSWFYVTTSSEQVLAVKMQEPVQMVVPLALRTQPALGLAITDGP